ncbi:alpha/beta hydrolase [Pedobacter panaciterrae]|uniref:alpha/beta hydrolase n=1 Tax=Pedobacter panaciterrae TaxID=363849 RepID=UPI00155D99BC|nr:alpha/beta hydrolase [Pedobacter panaciterrae]NQX55163.1 alpha/beta hydrolase [Pedobacter panaciterrae]
MRKIILFLFGVLLYAQGFAQETTYETKKDIGYYPASTKGDAYREERCKLDVYYPKNKTNSSTIVWFHGGGLTGGNKEMPRELLEKGFIVIAVGYRLSPKALVKDIIEDATASVAWTFNNIAKYGGNNKLIFVSGHSAGAYLGMMLTLDKKYLAAYNIDADSIAGLIPFSGQAITHFTVRQERKIKDVQPIIDEYAPLYHVRPTAPPMLLLTGDREMEMLGRYEENAYLARMMKLAGNKTTVLHELQGYGHDMVYPAIPLLIKEVNRLTKEIKTTKKIGL